MNHNLKSIIVLLIIIGTIALIGLTINQEGITGGTVANQVACYEDKDCNDYTQNTKDICKNPGTEFSLCVNRLNQ